MGTYLALHEIWRSWTITKALIVGSWKTVFHGTYIRIIINFKKYLPNTSSLSYFFSDSQIVPPPTTPQNFYKLGNDSYKLIVQKMRWDEARRQCQADDADLASILNPVTQAYMTLQMSSHNEPVWIGLNNNVVKDLPKIKGFMGDFSFTISFQQFA